MTESDSVGIWAAAVHGTQSLPKRVSEAPCPGTEVARSNCCACCLSLPMCPVRALLLLSKKVCSQTREDQLRAVWGTIDKCPTLSLSTIFSFLPFEGPTEQLHWHLQKSHKQQITKPQQRNSIMQSRLWHKCSFSFKTSRIFLEART